MGRIIKLKRMKKEIYCVVQNEDKYDFEKSVNEYIDLGYSPIGGISYSVLVMNSRVIVTFSQAMILKEKI